jgi:uncharacterized protein (TIGR02145 family)
VTNASGCTSPASANVVINANLSTPTAPTVGTITQPTCTVTTGSVVLNGLPSSGNWTLTRYPEGTTSNGSSTTTTVLGLPAGTTYNFTVTNASGCVSAVSGSVAITPQPTAPAATTGAYSVSTDDVVISGTVNAHYSSTQVTFEYGTTMGYGSTIIATPSLVSGNSDTPVNAILTVIMPNTHYYYRVAASNCAGTTNAIGKDFTTLPLTDKDGNTYEAVTIGTQVWMKENLKTTKYNDGTGIPLVTDNTIWKGLTTPAYCWYNNDANNKNIYGGIYNWYAVNTGKLCPSGWHVASSAEWDTLVLTLDPDAQLNMIEQSTIAGGKLKETGTSHWIYPNPATNESGFTALPGGCRANVGSDVGFIRINSWGEWYTSTEYSNGTVGERNIRYVNSSIYKDNQNISNKWLGLSVRCVKDN